MSKKNIKTIALIVFLVLLGLYSPVKVSARDNGKCTYTTSSGQYEIEFALGGQNEIIKATNVTTGEEMSSSLVKNWNNVKVNLLKCQDEENGTGCDYVCPKAIEARTTVHGCPKKTDDNGESIGTNIQYLYFYDDKVTGYKKNDVNKQIVSAFSGSKSCTDKKSASYGVSCSTYGLSGGSGSAVNRCLVTTPSAPVIHRDNPEAPSNSIECDGRGCREVTISSNVPPVELDLSTYTCGDGILKGVSGSLLKITSVAYTLMLIAVPVIIIILGSIDLFKGVMAQKEDEIKKGQQTFIKRLIAGLIVFFVLAIVKFTISVFNGESSKSIFACVDCIIGGPDSDSCVKDSN